jgi:ABC-type amino acid transport substrate-binding protein
MSKAGKVAILVFFLAVLCAVGGATIFALIEPSKSSSDVAKVEASDPPSKPSKAGAPPPESGESEALRRIRAAAVLRVGMDTGEPPWTGTPPMYQKDSAGKDAGFDVEVAEAIAAAIGVDKVEIVHARYSELPDLLGDPSGKIDLVISGYSPSELAGVVWSDPYLEYGLCLIVPTDSKIKSTKDLYGEAVGIFDDDAAAAEVGGLIKGYTELVRLEDGYWDQLLSGRFAGFVYDYPYAVAEINRFYAQNPHRKGAFRIAQHNLTDSTYAVGLRAADADLLGPINAALSAWMASPAYIEAVKRHLSSGLAAAAPKDATRRTVAVQAGDTLSRIAARELGGSERWKDIWALNKDRFPNPHLIEVGDQVILP